LIYFKYKILHPTPFKQAIPSFSLAHTVDCLRLDVMHPVVSGNKFFKLKYYIETALNKKAKSLASFGGPYSNHLVALAFAAKEADLQSIGYIRTNENEPLTSSLAEAKSYGMELVFLGRSEFQSKKEVLLKEAVANPTCYFIDEGGYGTIGAKGAATILTAHETAQYDYILAAVGTGTMLAGCINAALPHQKIIGIPVLKNEGSIKNEIDALLIDPGKSYTLLHQFHQGGYAKTNPSMIAYMNTLWKKEKIPTDIVYTSKLFFAVDQLIQENYFEQGASILILHSGGLQGNRSLPTGSLQF
jgi:1-aminocyclopropane-1-carboxylate deaminase